MRTPLAIAILLLLPTLAHAGPLLTFEREATRMHLRIGEQIVATYVWQDDQLPRPHFCNLFAPDGTRITRTHPPDPQADAGNDDHADFHPGAWLAFGDLGGADFWRLKARVRHLRFVQEPQVEAGVGSFSVENAYETDETPPRTLATELCTYRIRCAEDAYFLTTHSVFTAQQDGIAFGDQEEMGFGIRLATPLTVKHGNGTILNSAGGINEKGTWGKEAAWCAASGVMDGHRAGALLVPGPDNFRPSWFHSRDYGLLVANPFGKKSMTAPEDKTVPPDSTPLPREKTLTLDFGLYVFSNKDNKEPDYAALAQVLAMAMASVAKDN